MSMSDFWKYQLTAMVVLAAAVAVPASADAFCGAYVSGGKADLFNNATQVAMMRHEQTTVLSMQNNYEGPPKDFAMIVPTPVVLKKKNVKTLEEGVFDKLDTLTAPRLVEYWEQDPCQRPHRDYAAAGGADAGSFAGADASASKNGGGQVKVEAKFTVGEYDVVVLSSNESSALETWLKNHNYNIPSGAGPYLKPYIQKGAKFFVAKVNTKKVTFEDGEAVLSPLRFRYETNEFKLPVRLGLINSNGKQDLIVNILAKGQRYDVSNYPTTTIPTNIEVVAGVKDHFASFYRALFKETIAKHTKNKQKPVVTEYAWNAKSCDPCPFGGGLQDDTIMTLGGDHLAEKYEDVGQTRTYGRPIGDTGTSETITFDYDWVVTRLHTRYGADELGKDLVFQEATEIEGGRGTPNGELSQDAKESSRNNFQGRYIIKHKWDGAIDCEEPNRGNWGGRHGGSPSVKTSKGETNRDSKSTEEVDVNLQDEIKKEVAAIGAKPSAMAKNADDGIVWDGNGDGNGGNGNTPKGSSGDSDASKWGCSQSGGGTPIAPLALFALVGLFIRRRDSR